MAGKVLARWKGPIIESGDGLALIGTVHDPHVFYATGYRGTGITYAYIAAELFRDSVLGRENPYAALYAPTRGFLRAAYAASAINYLAEAVHGALRNWLFF